MGAVDSAADPSCEVCRHRVAAAMASAAPCGHIELRLQSAVSGDGGFGDGLAIPRGKGIKTGSDHVWLEQTPSHVDLVIGQELHGLGKDSSGNFTSSLE